MVTGGPPRFEGHDAGTPHEAWLRSAALRGAPPLERLPSALLVVAARTTRGGWRWRWGSDE